MIKYVAGFLFNNERTKVALIYKDHGPACMVGRWNAIGGKRAGQLESSTAAMWREFLEETGLSVTSWQLFLRLRSRHWQPHPVVVGDTEWEVDFFHAFVDDETLRKVRTAEREEVRIFNLDEALTNALVSNLRWIVPMALGHQDDHVWVYEVREADTFAPRVVSAPAED